MLRRSSLWWLLCGDVTPESLRSLIIIRSSGSFSAPLSVHTSRECCCAEACGGGGVGWLRSDHWEHGNGAE